MSSSAAQVVHESINLQNFTNHKHFFTIIVFNSIFVPHPHTPSWLIGGLQTRQSPGKVEKVCLPLLENSPALSWCFSVKQWWSVWFFCQCVAGWRFIPGAAVSPGTLWWRSGRSYRGRRTTSSSRPACHWDDAAAAAPTKPWSVFLRSRTRSPWRYLLGHTLHPRADAFRADS